MHREINFERIIEREFLELAGYQKGNPDDYDKENALFRREILDFMQRTQPKKWQRLAGTNPDNTETVLIDSLIKELKSKGILAVLRDGFKCFGKILYLAYFAPNTGMNPEAIELYGKNRLTITRQVKTRTGAIPDILLSLNGLPIATLELKNPLTGKTYRDAIKQYREERDPIDPLFTFKQRCLVHFAVDTEQVWMTTRLDKTKTRFLPFNRGHNNGTGNPPDPDRGYRTSYLWLDILRKDSLLEIIGRFLHLETEQSLIFPRYHQLDAVRQLIHHAKSHGSGHNYLIQHSAGSGKSNSIAWLAYRLSTLHDERDEKIFHSVIVITDRAALDRQLQNTIYQFDHKAGVVQKIDEDTRQLAKALADGVPIIISTIQKFGFITTAIETLAKKGENIAIDTTDKRFAIIVDEAHSSQSGETATELKKILNKQGIESIIAEQILDTDENDNLDDKARAELLREQLKRARQPNLSFFAFTATPKYRTLLTFDEPGSDGQAPFHRYTMKQAIEEGYIRDVLAHYTCYRRYYHLIRTVADDPAVPRRQTARALARFIELHPHNIGQKVEIIIEHFRNYTRPKIRGRAKAMIVTGSREHAVRYKLAFDKYLKEKGYREIKSLVAFSDAVRLDDFPDEKFTEVNMNGGIGSSEIPTRFDSDEYSVLIVADKYQTGFDQPLLHTLYVDKRLSGVQAVQTLSRLNRVAPEKLDTFVLDFVNEPEDIYQAFKPYYEVTPIGENADPRQLDDLYDRLLEWRIFDRTDIDSFCAIWFRDKTSLTVREHQQLNQLLDPIVDRYGSLIPAGKDRFRGQLTAFCKLYAFLAQILPYQDSHLEKLHAYGRFLQKKLPRDGDDRAIDVTDNLELEYYRLEKISTGAIDLRAGDATPLQPPTAVGTRQRDREVQLSELVDTLNERFGTDFTPADRLFFDRIGETALESEPLRQAARVNDLQNFAPVFRKYLDNFLLEHLEGNERIFRTVMNNEEIRSILSNALLESIYDRLRSL